MRGRLGRTTTKIAASARSVDLPPVLLAALKRHREAQERERQEAGDRRRTGFPEPVEEGLEPIWCTHILNRMWQQSTMKVKLTPPGMVSLMQPRGCQSCRGKLLIPTRNAFFDMLAPAFRS